LPVETATVSASVAVWLIEPETPFTLTLAAPTVASAAAVKVIDCGVPGVNVSVDGAAVTPVGNPVSEMPTVPLNPFTAATDTAVDCPKAPVVRLRLVGLIVSVKSAGGGAAVTTNLIVAVCDNDPDVPVNVIVLELAAALAAALNVTLCGVPALTVSDAGFAVTPAGNPAIATLTAELNPLIALTETEAESPAPPLVIFTVEGLTSSEKSFAAAVTTSVTVAVWLKDPDVPVNVIVLELAAALVAAVNVTLCGVPALTVSDDGLAVTPAGNPEIATLTPALNPLIALTETVAAPPAPPPVIFTVDGLAANEKSGGGAAATVTATVAV